MTQCEPFFVERCLRGSLHSFPTLQLPLSEGRSRSRRPCCLRCMDDALQGRHLLHHCCDSLEKDANVSGLHFLRILGGWFRFKPRYSDVAFINPVCGPPRNMAMSRLPAVGKLILPFTGSFHTNCRRWREQGELRGPCFDVPPFKVRDFTMVMCEPTSQLSH